MTLDDHKKTAAERAVTLVEPGMKLGLGTGSTAAHFVRALARRVKEGLDVVCVPTSVATAEFAAQLGVPLTTLDQEPFLDLTVDGADEIDDALCLIKGAGGALLREKIVATASSRMVVIADHTKKVATLGKFPLPVEVVEFGLKSTRLMIEDITADLDLNVEIALRTGRDGKPVRTDGGNLLLDCAFGRIDDPDALDAALKLVPGIVENGLFLGIADVAIIAGPDGVNVIDVEFGEGDIEP